MKVEGETSGDGEADMVMVGVKRRAEDDEANKKYTNAECSAVQFHVIPRTFK